MASGYEKAGTDFDSIFALRQAGWPQAGVTNFRISGTDANARYAPLATGSAVAAVNARVNGTDFASIFAGLGTTNVQVATQPSAVSGSAAAGNPSGTVTSNTTTVAGSKGKGTYTFTWHLTITTGSGVTETAPSSATSGVTGSIPAGQTYSGTRYCTISDGVTSANTESAAWSLTNTSPAIWNFEITSGNSGASYGYSAGSIGSIVSGGTLAGRTITQVLQAYLPGEGIDTLALSISGFSADPGAASLTAFTLGAWAPATYVSYGYSGGVASWSFNGLAYGGLGELTPGGNFSGTIQATWL